jgi:transcriptional regulator with XRE-family HTH domain
MNQAIRPNTPGAALALQSIREELELNQKEFAKKLGVTPPAVCMWENGQRSIPITVFRQCANLSGMTIQIVILPTGQTKIFLIKPKDEKVL